MTEQDHEAALIRALSHAQRWRAEVGERHVGPVCGVEEMLDVFGGPLPEEGLDPAAVIDRLGEGAEPGLMAIQSGRFFGWVMGGTLPAALGADWLVSAWDQNAGLRHATPAVAALEEVAAGWLLDLLGLPDGADVGFTTGATMANFTGLAAGRGAVLAKVGWDVHTDGLTGAPRVHVLVGAERHDTVDIALRYLGLGSPTVVAANEQGRIRSDALAEVLSAIPQGEPIIVALQAGNLHSGAFDPFREAIELAHARGAWVHVDGAFGLWAAASPTLSHLIDGVEAADSWATDAHKTLNVTYDCGIVVVRDPQAVRTAMGVHASYLTPEDSGPGNPFEKVPELSRRARGVPVWAALRSLGRSGAVQLVDHLADTAQHIAAGLADVPGVTVLNDVVYTQICLGVEGDVPALLDRLVSNGEVWMSGSRWRDRPVVRISVSNAATTNDDVRRTIEAVRLAVVQG